MSTLTKPLIDEFIHVSNKAPDFTDAHKALIDHLQDIVNDINAGNVFTAKIEGVLKTPSSPGLTIKHNSDGKGQTFFIEFKDDAYGKPRLKLSTGLERTSISETYESYDLSDEDHRTAMLSAIGRSLAIRLNRNAMGEAVTAYATRKL